MVKREKIKIDVDAKLSDFYAMLTTEQARMVRENMTLQTYKKNECIYNEGERPDQMFIMLSGKAKIFKDGVGGRSQTMRLVKPVDYFGFRAYLAHEDFITTASVIESSIIAKVPLSVMIPILKVNSKLSWYFIQRFAVALGQSDERCINLTQKHIRARLADALLMLKKHYGVEEDGVTLSIYLSREDLAELSNMTTANAIRTLSSFVSEKVLIIDGRKIKFANLEELEHISKMG